MVEEGALSIVAGPLTLRASLELARAPKTCATLRTILPLRGKLLQARWSGEAAWMPMGELRVGLEYENHTSYPAPGEILWYPGGVSEMEILIPYGATRFASKAGQLAGNHVATIRESRDVLEELGRLVLWQGVQDIVIAEIVT